MPGSRNFVFQVVMLIFLLLNGSWGKAFAVANPSADSVVDRKKLTTVLIGGSALYAAGMTGLYSIWYRNYPQSSFHFFDDHREWLQVDKTGHFTTAYYVGYLGYEAFHYTGVNEKKSVLFGGLVSWVFLATIETFDGFSEQWGASATDMAANTLGCTLFAGQQLMWHEQRIGLKWSFHSTDFPSYRPDLLGNSFAESMIKDYNGQTYWLSINLKSFMNKDSKMPDWLNVSFGYGAEGMTGASVNSLTYNGMEIPTFERYRQFYIGPDIDLVRIKTRSALLNTVFKTFGFIRLPLPAFEFNRNGVKFHPLCF
jgi:hypothetical protein